ncbi:MAG: hypothetical protein QG628_100 [Patescibacteria group bacterium]|nr:hypothetical protein [Patescibacteria group bacterium]
MSQTKIIEWNFQHLLVNEIKQNGGWVNAHAHIDRAFTITPESLDIYRKHTLEEKWDLVDAVKNASEDEYYRRISMGLELMISQGVTAVGSFIDIDPVAEDRAIKAALRAKEQYKDQIKMVTINQVLKGVIEPEARKWFDIASDYVDIIGGLPKRDERDHGKGEEHFDILLETAKKKGKMVHVHVDQFNTQTDKETEMLADKTIQHGMEGKVVAVHAISVASHPKEYREIVYEKMNKAQIMVIACPTAWIDAPRKEEIQPFHNALTPVDEMVKHGITVAIGSDNIADYMLPFTDGDMWSELKLMAIGNRFMDLDALVKIATVNGRKVIGLE